MELEVAGMLREASRAAFQGTEEGRAEVIHEVQIVIEKLTKNVNEGHLHEIFGAYGRIKDIDLPMNRQFMTNRGTAHILYATTSDAEAAIAHMHEGQLDGVTISVSIVLPRRKFSRSPPPFRRNGPGNDRFDTHRPASGGYRSLHRPADACLRQEGGTAVDLRLETATSIFIGHAHTPGLGLLAQDRDLSLLDLEADLAEIEDVVTVAERVHQCREVGEGEGAPATRAIQVSVIAVEVGAEPDTTEINVLRTKTASRYLDVDTIASREALDKQVHITDEKSGTPSRLRDCLDSSMATMQPTLAPAPHPMRAPVSEGAAEQRKRNFTEWSFWRGERLTGGGFLELRERLLAQGLHGPNPAPAHRLDGQQPHPSLHPHEHNIDPAIAGPGMMSGESGGDENHGDGKKGKRELSTSKRAAQNRAAQRAFRQRKEGHIKQLEAQVKDYNSLSENYKALQAENYQLRDYIISLQSRLIESQGEFPQPPSNIDIHPQRSSGQVVPAPTAPMGSSAASQLQASAAQAITDLSGGKHQNEENSFPSSDDPATKRVRMGEEDTDTLSTSSHQMSTSLPEQGNRAVVS
ncbi:MAG: hypothetical protein LQ351_004648 [Letrouitia transgressa]|nr:MAG: hypothetical protein LQ351_004648 [Letrouitia transgressa]